MKWVLLREAQTWNQDDRHLAKNAFSAIEKAARFSILCGRLGSSKLAARILRMWRKVNLQRRNRRRTKFPFLHWKSVSFGAIENSLLSTRIQFFCGFASICRAKQRRRKNCVVVQARISQLQILNLQRRKRLIFNEWNLAMSQQQELCKSLLIVCKNKHESKLQKWTLAQWKKCSKRISVARAVK